MADPVVTLTNGVPTSGSGAITTLGQLIDATNGPAAIKAASTAPAAADKAIVVAFSPNSYDKGPGTSGSLTQRVIIDSSQFSALGQTLMAASAPVVIASNQSAVPVTQGVSATVNGATTSRINAAASNNLTSVKASAGQVYTIDVFNVAAYNVFLKLYNKASAPVVASDTPIMTIPIQAGGGYSKTWSMGLPFSTGIAYAIVKLQADTDATNVVAGDLTGNILWI